MENRHESEEISSLSVELHVLNKKLRPDECIVLFNLKEKWCKKLKMEEVVNYEDFVHPEEPCIVLFQMKSDDYLEDIKFVYNIDSFIETECSQAMLRNGNDNITKLDEDILLTISDASYYDDLDKPAKINILLRDNLMLIFASEPLYCIEQCFQKELNFSDFPNMNIGHEQWKFMTHRIRSNLRLEIGEEDGCSQIEAILHRIIEVIFARFEEYILLAGEEGKVCNRFATSLSFRERSDFILRSSIAERNLVYLQDLIKPKAKILSDLSRYKKGSINFCYYLRTLAHRAKKMSHVIKSHTHMIQTAQYLYDVATDDALTKNSFKLAFQTRLFMVAATTFIPILIFVGMMSVNIRIPYQDYSTNGGDLKPFVTIVGGSLGYYIIVMLYFRWRRWI
ncbi:unnamed protein product [Blepharisma stoltei]|uniref:Magnesium transporter n=1 Tax=Blepharisma stoltei TaxID=1481888 RepID=A0AAU9JEQ6_9CILI|nr:unnamed protein product [Blepharisma stoltei]